MQALKHWMSVLAHSAHVDVDSLIQTQRCFLKWSYHMVCCLLLISMYCFFDKMVAGAVAPYQLQYSWLAQLTRFGHGNVYVVLFLALAVTMYYWGRQLLAARFLLITVWITGSYYLCGLLKVLCGRTRPHEWITHHLFGFFGPSLSNLYHSFPSGHTTTWTALAGAAGFFFPKYVKWFFLIACILGLSRMFMAQHFMSDVLGSVYLTWIEWVLLLLWLKKARS